MLTADPMNGVRKALRAAIIKAARRVARWCMAAV
jgi:hypothetical protein